MDFTRSLESRLRRLGDDSPDDPGAAAALHTYVFKKLSPFLDPTASSGSNDESRSSTEEFLKESQRRMREIEEEVRDLDADLVLYKRKLTTTRGGGGVDLPVPYGFGPRFPAIGGGLARSSVFASYPSQLLDDAQPGFARAVQMGQTGRRVKFDEGDGIVVVGGGGLPLPRIASGEESVTVAKARLDDPVVDARPSFVARDDRAQQDASVSNQDKAAGWFSFLFMFFFNELFFS